MANEMESTETRRGKIHNERLIDDTRRLRLSVATVELPDGHEFEQYVMRMPKALIVAVLDGDEHVLMMWRHRFIIDKWVWELPGGYVDSGEDPAAAALREVEEETGWRPRNIECLGSFQPMTGSADAQNIVHVARGADYVGDVIDINEAARVQWIPLSEVRALIASGEIPGAASQVALLHILCH